MLHQSSFPYIYYLTGNSTLQPYFPNLESVVWAPSPTTIFRERWVPTDKRLEQPTRNGTHYVTQEFSNRDNSVKLRTFVFPADVHCTEGYTFCTELATKLTSTKNSSAHNFFINPLALIINGCWVAIHTSGRCTIQKKQCSSNKKHQVVCNGGYGDCQYLHEQAMQQGHLAPATLDLCIRCSKCSVCNSSLPMQDCQGCNGRIANAQQLCCGCGHSARNKHYTGNRFVLSVASIKCAVTTVRPSSMPTTSSSQVRAMITEFSNILILANASGYFQRYCSSSCALLCGLYPQMTIQEDKKVFVGLLNAGNKFKSSPLWALSLLLDCFGYNFTEAVALDMFEQCISEAAYFCWYIISASDRRSEIHSRLSYMIDGSSQMYISPLLHMLVARIIGFLNNDYHGIANVEAFMSRESWALWITQSGHVKCVIKINDIMNEEAKPVFPDSEFIFNPRALAIAYRSTGSGNGGSSSINDDNNNNNTTAALEASMLTVPSTAPSLTLAPVAALMTTSDSSNSANLPGVRGRPAVNPHAGKEEANNVKRFVVANGSASTSNAIVSQLPLPPVHYNNDDDTTLDQQLPLPASEFAVEHVVCTIQSRTTVTHAHVNMLTDPTTPSSSTTTTAMEFEHFNYDLDSGSFHSSFQSSFQDVQQQQQQQQQQQHEQQHEQQQDQQDQQGVQEQQSEDQQTLAAPSPFLFLLSPTNTTTSNQTAADVDEVALLKQRLLAAEARLVEAENRLAEREKQIQKMKKEQLEMFILKHTETLTTTRRVGKAQRNNDSRVNNNSRPHSHYSISREKHWRQRSEYEWCPPSTPTPAHTPALTGSSDTMTSSISIE